jgi:hypothetical protein
MKTNKSFYLVGSYRTYLPIKELNKAAKAYWRRVDAMKKQEDIERKRILLSCSILTAKDLVPAGVI